jgi:hypothetical protein
VEDLDRLEVEGLDAIEQPLARTPAWHGGSGPHHPFQPSSRSPRIGPNMLRPMT